MHHTLCNKQQKAMFVLLIKFWPIFVQKLVSSEQMILWKIWYYTRQVCFLAIPIKNTHDGNFCCMAVVCLWFFTSARRFLFSVLSSRHTFSNSLVFFSAPFLDVGLPFFEAAQSRSPSSSLSPLLIVVSCLCNYYAITLIQ